MRILIVLLIFMINAGSVYAQKLKPYVLAGVEQGTIKEAEAKVTGMLESNGFEILGKYSPMDDPERIVICVTNDDLKGSVISQGGLRGFAAVLRVGIHMNYGENEISYQNPKYWGNAYYQKDYPQVSANYDKMSKTFKSTFSGLAEVKDEEFGSKGGKSEKDLRGYRYKMMMPKFHDVDELAKKTNYNEILTQIRETFENGSENFKKVYEISFPEQKLTLFGVALTGEKGEKHFLPKIDIKEPKHLPFAPYEVLVMEDKVVALRGRYRIAISFPDLSMGTFMKISSAPGDIKDALKKIVENRKK
ncbi:hypothetical protein ACFL7D_01575 [candidate division KSB1 bacterium]